MPIPFMVASFLIAVAYWVVYKWLYIDSIILEYGCITLAVLSAVSFIYQWIKELRS